MVAYTSSEEINHQYDLNSLQKSSKNMKKPPTSSNAKPAKVYKVKPIHFRELVQKLTGAQQHDFLPQPRALQSIAPPPLPIQRLQFENQIQTRLEEKPGVCKVEQDYTSATVDENSFVKREAWEGITELNLSPNFQSWFNFAMLSPGPARISN